MGAPSQVLPNIFPFIVMLLLALLAITPDVLDVDSVQGPYLEIRHAIEASSDGDLIRVAPGDYGWFGVFGKSLSVVSADPTGEVNIVGAVRVQNLDLDDRVLLSGLSIEKELFSPDEAMILASNRGSVRIQDCDIDGVTYQAMRITGCDDVTIEQSTVVAGRSYVSSLGGHYARVGIVVTNSSLSVWNSTISASEMTISGYTGMAAVSASNSDLLLHGGTVTGGGGGPDDYDFSTATCFPGGSGGPGVSVANGGLLRVLDCALAGGPGGPGTDCGENGGDGSPYSSFNSTVELIPGAGLALDCAALAPESSTYTVEASGAPGDLILLVIGPDTARVDLPAFTGDLHVGGPAGGARRTLLGTGNVTAQLQLPALPAFTTAGLYLQTVHLRSGEVVFGPVRGLTVLDSAW